MSSFAADLCDVDVNVKLFDDKNRGKPKQKPIIGPCDFLTYNFSIVSEYGVATSEKSIQFLEVLDVCDDVDPSILRHIVYKEIKSVIFAVSELGWDTKDVAMGAALKLPSIIYDAIAYSGDKDNNGKYRTHLEVIRNESPWTGFSQGGKINIIRIKSKN